MKRLILAILAAAAIHAAPALAEDPAAHYQTLLAAAKASTGPVNWTALRYAWAEQPDYYGTLDDDDRAAMFKAANSGDWNGALAAANKVIDATYFDAGGHMVAAIAYAKTGDPANAQREKTITDAIFASIRTGDGLTADTAFTVIAVSEEYDMMSYMGVSPTAQSLSHQGEHSFDIMDTTDENGKKVTYYFNIDRAWEAEGRMFNLGN